ncbi:amidase [Pochonia chlamydosporia 170]|uniref:Dehydrogenase FUB6 n=1 Tax=Pochonia chlamydosporia 170 TaxID=1380566 RepID=A0A179FKN4_METCM|nr:amidase [Pochonia chlamydosporia 170]OAQ66114.1 amidase [Pochonia chlamydosporia 170]
MVPMNVRVVLEERPTESIIPGRTFRKETVPVPSPKDLQDGEILVEVLLISMEPAMRGWLNDTRSYLPPVQIGETMRSFSAACVLASKSTQAQVGDIVVAVSGWTQYAIVPEGKFEPASIFPKYKNIQELLSTYGLTGMTAWAGMTQIGDPKPGETVVVSAAAGATGSIAGQIAKIKGARVIGICGGEKKCRYIREELGFDVALDYKAPDFRDKFLEATKDFIDVCFDNVGFETLDMCLGQANKGARFIQCGMVAKYSTNATDVTLTNYFKVISMRIKTQGFVVTDYADKWSKAREEMAQWVEQGQLKSAVTVVDGGLDVVEEALLKLFSGYNTGKMLVRVKDESEPPAEL